MPLRPTPYIATLALLGAGAVAHAQSWVNAYDEGIKSAAKGDWAEARTQFRAAAAFRPEDVSNPTPLPGPPTERRVWRDGSPYSPNFLAAYAAYKIGTVETEDGRAQLNAAAAEFETLLAKGQNSPEVFYFLNLVYSKTSQPEKRTELAQKYETVRGKLTFKVDRSGLTPEDRGQVEALSAPAGGTTTTTPAGGINPNTIPVVNARDLPNSATGATLPTGAVAKVPTKYALIVANADSRLPNASLSFALADAARVKDALIASAGYPEENVVVLTNTTSAAMLSAAKELAARATSEGTVFLYFTGVGANVDGKDYLAGVDTDLPTDTSTMVRKLDFYAPFIEKGLSIFAFYQANRTVMGGRYFGSEAPVVGRIAQVQATIPGETVTGIYHNGQFVGLFSDALTQVMTEFRSNAIPITEFSWQVFYRMRRGASGISGGGGRQTPTLPILNILGSDARF